MNNDSSLPSTYTTMHNIPQLWQPRALQVLYSLHHTVTSFFSEVEVEWLLCNITSIWKFCPLCSKKTSEPCWRSFFVTPHPFSRDMLETNANALTLFPLCGHFRITLHVPLYMQLQSLTHSAASFPPPLIPNGGQHLKWCLFLDLAGLLCHRFYMYRLWRHR